MLQLKQATCQRNKNKHRKQLLGTQGHIYQKDATIAVNPNPPPPVARLPYIPGTWRTWDDATTRYNGGGVPNYLQRVDRAFLSGQHPTDPITIWPLQTDGKARK